MKYLLFFPGVIIGCIITMNALAQNAPGLTFNISNPQDAQALYQILSGVKEEGAAGHTFRKGRSILCWHTNADMNDAQGNPVPANDPKRYGCSMHIDDRGRALPGQPF
jgi:hypothetical protein